MNKNLLKWSNENNLAINYSNFCDNEIITIDEVGSFLYLKPSDGKIIDEDFFFIVDENEFDFLDEEKADFILFEFGKRFYYSPIKKEKNKYNELGFKPEFNDFKYLGKTSEQFVLEFSHFGIHSEYELMNGSGSCENWVKKAVFLGCHSIGVCDKNTLASSLLFQTICEKNKIKSIIGETITVAVNFSKEKKNQETFELKMYVINYNGWKNLLLINKAINIDFEGFIPEELLYTLGGGLCCVIPKESYFNYIKRDDKKIKALILNYKKSFDKVYYQIDTVEYSSKQLFYNHLENIDFYICNYKNEVPPILINDSYYLDKEESIVKSAVNKVNGVAYPESNTQFFKTVSETVNSYSEWIKNTPPLFDAILDGIKNAAALSDIIDFKINAGERKLPNFEVENVEELFFDEVEKGLNYKLGHIKPKEMEVYLKRIETECNVIVPNGLCDYFMILWDVARWCNDNDINLGAGRGSVCGSLIAYCLNITSVDPIKYGLMFERFLNSARVTPPEVFEIEFENGEKINIPINSGIKIPLVNGDFVCLSQDLDFKDLDVDFKKLSSLLEKK